MTRSMIGNAQRRVVSVITAATFLSCRFDDSPNIPETVLAEQLSTICDPSYACECRGAAREFYEMDNTECLMTVEEWVIDAQASPSGLVYSQTCAEDLWTRLVGFLDDVAEDCPTDAARGIFSVACENECQIYFGTVAIGEPCERFGRRMSTCAADLTCGFDGRCYPPCEQPLVIPAGATCSYASGLLEEQCAAGLLCDPGTQTCVEALPAGASCDPDAPLCAPADWCSHDTATCSPRLPLGSTCQAHEECASAVCRDVCESEDPYQCDHPWF